MEIGVYDIINNPLPELYLIKNLKVDVNDFEYDEDIVNVMNKHLLLDKLNSEHIYALGLTRGLIPKGIIMVSVGDDKESKVDIRGLAIGLLLIGAEQFMVFHNHPGENKEVSILDQLSTNQYKELSDIIGIKFIRHLMVTKDYFCECKEIDL